MLPPFFFMRDLLLSSSDRRAGGTVLLDHKTQLVATTSTSTKHAAPGKRAAKVEFDPERAARLLRRPLLSAGPALLTCSVGSG
jgi:hypothetical protein